LKPYGLPAAGKTSSGKRLFQPQRLECIRVPER
jgi:hypothetical protein